VSDVPSAVLIDHVMELLPKALRPGDDFINETWKIQKRLGELDRQNILLLARDWFAERPEGGYLFVAGMEDDNGINIYRVDKEGTQLEDDDPPEWAVDQPRCDEEDAVSEIASFLENLSGLANDDEDFTEKLIKRMNAHHWNPLLAHATMTELSAEIGMSPTWLDEFYAYDQSKLLETATPETQQAPSRKPRL
jgi:hypothetical protein